MIWYDLLEESQCQKRKFDRIGLGKRRPHKLSVLACEQRGSSSLDASWLGCRDGSILRLQRSLY